MPVSRLGRDVGRQQLAERRLDRAAAGESRPLPGSGVAGGAIAGDGEIAAALDLVEILLVDGGCGRGAAT